MREGDYLEAELVEGGVLLRPVSIVRRQEAWRQVRAALGSVRPTPEQAAEPLEDQEREILEVVNETRCGCGDERRRP